jgi:NADP-reducing hydrogenase subunit HndB
MMTVEKLEALRKQWKAELDDKHSKETQIIVGMGTCGIAAGARGVMAAILAEVDNRQLKNISVLQTGCIGMCAREVLVDVVRPGEDRITYGSVKPSDVKRIIGEHVVNGNIVEDLVVAKIAKEELA